MRSQPKTAPLPIYGEVHLALDTFGPCSAHEVLRVLADDGDIDADVRDAMRLHDVQLNLGLMVTRGAATRKFAGDGTVLYALVRKAVSNG